MRITFGLVQQLTGLGKTKSYAAMKAGKFPQPERDGPRCSRWRVGDILDWLEERRRELQALEAAGKAAAVAPPAIEPAQVVQPLRRGRGRPRKVVELAYEAQPEATS
jgi:prophage regulatory protein